MATILRFRQRKSETACRRGGAGRASVPASFPAIMDSLTARIDWSEATVEDEYDAVLAAFDIVCRQPSARRSMRAA